MKASIVIGGLLLAGCACRPPSRSDASEAYARGEADAVKRLYWAKQALEAPGVAGPAGRVRYYTWTDGGEAADGRRLAPVRVAVPVFIPDPAPADGGR
ncbi:MAG TPA: hypothetical protein VGG34_10910 [Opitutaceae bacterium]